MTAATNLRQSEKLLRLGLSQETADMCWTSHCYGSLRSSMTLSAMTIDEYKTLLKRFADSSTTSFEPAWSLSALLNVMPRTMNGVPKKAAFHLALKKYPTYWCCCYEHFAFGEINVQKGNSDLEAAYNMVVWLLENSYINQNTENDSVQEI